jgi:hypothetical protein
LPSSTRAARTNAGLGGIGRYRFRELGRMLTAFAPRVMWAVHEGAPRPKAERCGDVDASARIRAEASTRFGISRFMQRACGRTEMCLLIGAQLALSRRLLSSLVVKPENMLRNLDRSGGVVLSEAVMMALAGRIGRDRAHALVLRISREALRRKQPFREAVAEHPEVRRHLTPKRIAAVLDYRNSLGLAGRFVDDVCRAWERLRRRSAKSRGRLSSL